VQNGHVDVVTALLKEEAIDVDIARTDGSKALHMAVPHERSVERHAKIFSALVKKGANLKDQTFAIRNKDEKGSAPNMEFFDLRGVDLPGVIFEGTVDLEGAMMDKHTVLAGAQMKGAIDLAKMTLNGKPASQATDIPAPMFKQNEVDEARTWVKRVGKRAWSAIKKSAASDSDSDDDDSDSDEESDEDDDQPTDEEEKRTTDEVNAALYEQRSAEDVKASGPPPSQSWREDVTLLAFLAMLSSDSVRAGGNPLWQSMDEAVEVLVKAIKIQIEQQKNLIEMKVRVVARAAAEKLGQATQEMKLFPQDEKFRGKVQETLDRFSKIKDKFRKLDIGDKSGEAK
jgi:hypothetical protein